MIVMRNSAFSGLQFVLEDCNVHTFKETEKLYLKEYNRDINEDYIISESSVVGSGSIGQVYKAYCKKRNEYIAIKVKHPNIDSNVRSMVYALKIICFFLRPINKFHNFIMEYIDGIYLQIDYIQEAKNTIKLKNDFHDETCIVIPEIINYSNNFICMSYHEGKLYKNVSEQSKLIASMYINFFYIISLVVYDFLHADLHFGNWKIIEKENDVQLLIYDCGIMCSTGDTNLNKEILENTFNRRNFMKILDSIKKIDPCICIKEQYKVELEKIIRFDISSSECLTMFLNKLNDYNLVKNKNIFRMMSSIAIIGETPAKSVSAITKYIYSQLESNTILYHIHVGLLTKMDKFRKLKEYYIRQIEENSDYKEDYLKWLYDEFGHKKGSILDTIIYNKFFPKVK